MKHMKLFVAASVMMLSIDMSAQSQGGRPMPPKQRTPEEIAKKESDRMKFEVNLTEKQYKKVFKLIKKDQEYRQSQTGKQFEEGMPPQGRGPGMGAPGGMVAVLWKVVPWAEEDLPLEKWGKNLVLKEVARGWNRERMS